MGRMIPKFPEGERFHYTMPDGATTSFDVYDPHEKGKEGRGMKTCSIIMFTQLCNMLCFYGCKNDNLQIKNCDNFLIFAQNIDCGCWFPW